MKTITTPQGKIMENEIEKLALKRFPHTDEGSLADCIYSAKRSIWSEGYKAAQQKGVYSKEDMRKIAQAAFTIKSNNESLLGDFDKWFTKKVESLNQETIELEMEDSKTVEKYEFDGTEHGEILWARQLKTNRVNGQLTAYVKT